MPVTQITSLDQYHQVTERHTVSVIQYGTPILDSCKRMSEIFASYSERYTGIDFFFVDSEQNREIVANAGVLAYPTFVVFEGGVEGGVDAVVGANYRDLERTLKIFSPSPPSSPGFC